MGAVYESISGDAAPGFAALERRLCSRAAGAVEARFVLGILRLVSRIGDWPLSAAMGAVLWLVHGLPVLLAWTGVTAAALAVQKALKKAAGRPRPCEVAGGPPQRAPIPDAGSFPSGHTLHAVMAAVAAAGLLPSLAAALALLAFLMGLSRVALGVHYPSDVLAGAALGGLAGWVFLLLSGG